MKGFFFKFVGVPGGSPELGKGNSGWVPSYGLFTFIFGGGEAESKTSFSNVFGQ